MTEPDPKPADGRPVVWLAVKPNGNPEMGTAASPEAVPDRAVMWCRTQDKEWTRRTADRSASR